MSIMSKNDPMKNFPSMSYLNEFIYKYCKCDFYTMICIYWDTYNAEDMIYSKETTATTKLELRDWLLEQWKAGDSDVNFCFRRYIENKDLLDKLKGIYDVSEIVDTIDEVVAEVKKTTTNPAKLEEFLNSYGTSGHSPCVFIKEGMVWDSSLEDFFEKVTEEFMRLKEEED